MGRHGPAPEPTASKLARGETRPSRVNFEGPMPRQRPPAMPRGMSPDAQRAWAHVLREMGDSGVILAVDGLLLRAFCEAYAGWLRAERLLRTSGPVIRGQRGNEVVVNPLHRVNRDEREAVRLLGRELGLSPAARAGLRIDLNAAASDMDDVLPALPRPRLVAGGEPD